MAYIVFDLDETLAHMYTPFYFLCDLRREKTLDINTPPPNILQKALDIAYRTFVLEITRLEIQTPPLGLLRPGILDVMKRIQELKTQNKVKGVIIYSNNGHLSNLELVRDIVHLYVGDNSLICDCIHWGRKGREAEHGLPKQIGAADKTWDVLRSLLVQGPCKATPDVSPDQIYFFDDQMHPDLRRNLPEGHYKMVTPYKFKASFDRMAEIYKHALEFSTISTNPEMWTTFTKYAELKCSNRPFEKGVLDDMMNLYKKHTHRTANTILPPEPDNTINVMMKVLDEIESKQIGSGCKRAHRSYKYRRRCSHYKRKRFTVNRRR